MTTASAPRAPYALAPTPFPFPALATLAGHSPLGGARETALACFMVARVVSDCFTDASMGSDQKRARAQGMKHWLGAAALPTPIRNSLTRVMETALAEDGQGTKTALDSVIAVTANQLDPGARLELGRLAQAVVK